MSTKAQGKTPEKQLVTKCMLRDAIQYSQYTDKFLNDDKYLMSYDSEKQLICVEIKNKDLAKIYIPTSNVKYFVLADV